MRFCSSDPTIKNLTMASISQTRASSKADAKAAERERLRQALPATVGHLRQHQAGQIDDNDIEAYVQLNWLEWHGGGLRLTITGRNVCAQVATPTS